MIGISKPAERHDDGSTRAWARRWWRPLLAELVATGLLVRLACSPGAEGGDQLTRGALSAGLVVVGNICAFGETSGAHMNPAFTLAALMCGRLPAAAALAYVAAQCAGAALGHAALTGCAGSAAGALCVTAPAPGVSPLAALSTELVATCAAVLALCGVWACPDPSAPLKVGLLVSGLVYCAGPTSGASFNPARSFGPALVTNHWTDHWVYWAGPLGGAALGALLHRWVLAPRPHHAAPRTGSLPQGGAGDKRDAHDHADQPLTELP